MAPREQVEVPALFDRRQRRLRRDRAVRQGREAILHQRGFDELLERLGDARKRFGPALLLGCASPKWRQRLEGLAGRIVCADPSPLAAARSAGVVADEDRLPFADASFDLILSVGTLDTVDDLPGALALIRRALRPGGLFLGALAGGGSLPALRASMLAADAEAAGAAPRIHPGIDVRTAGDLLARAGFILPVADVDRIALSYQRLGDLVADLRAHGATNILSARARTPVSAAALRSAEHAFAQLGEDGRTMERIELIYLSGWAPEPTSISSSGRSGASAGGISSA